MKTTVKAADLAEAVNGGASHVIRICTADGLVLTPVIERATVQRFGSMDLITFHQPGAPDHIGALSCKPDYPVELV